MSEKEDGLVNTINESYKIGKEVEKEAYKEGHGVTSSQSPTISLQNSLVDRIL